MNTTQYAKRSEVANPRAPERRRSATADAARDRPGCEGRAEALVGFTVRSRFTGSVFVVTGASEENGCRTIRGRDCWAMVDAVMVIAPPEGIS
ncbi:MAG TPA: hypothetical protein VJQ84_01220 [Solirubrobacterales bacterium]|nr:hypothetical protein [Solirubrobacterales bacterium]